MTNKELMAALTDAGIDFKPQTPKAELEALLAANVVVETSEGEEAPDVVEVEGVDEEAAAPAAVDDNDNAPDEGEEATKGFAVTGNAKGKVDVCGVVLANGESHSFDLDKLSATEQKRLNNAIKCGLVVEA